MGYLDDRLSTDIATAYPAGGLSVPVVMAQSLASDVAQSQNQPNFVVSNSKEIGEWLGDVNGSC